MSAWHHQLAIAQLVERWTVELQLKSIGHWFDSGSRDFCLFFLHKVTLKLLVFIVTCMNIIICDVTQAVRVTRDSSVGRAVDCSVITEIHRSLVRFRFARILFYKVRT